MYVPYSTNCFDLIGFDILIDDTLKPWLLEVNMSPSLACESQLDTQVKAPLMSDLLNLIGIINVKYRGKQKKNKSYRSTFTKPRTSKARIQSVNGQSNSNDLRLIKYAKEELDRKGNFYLAFPNENYPYYKKFFEES